MLDSPVIYAHTSSVVSVGLSGWGWLYPVSASMPRGRLIRALSSTFFPSLKLHPASAPGEVVPHYHVVLLLSAIVCLFLLYKFSKVGFA